MARVQTDTATNEHARRHTPARAATRPLLRAWWLLTVLFSLLAGVLAYQIPPTMRLAVGQLGDQLFLPRGQAQSQEETALGRWYGDEPTDHAPGGRSRWTRKNAQIELPGLGDSGTLRLTITAQGWPTDVLNGRTRQPLVTVLVNGAPADTFTPTPAWGSYPIELPAPARPGDPLSIRLEASDVFTSTAQFADLRPKGIRVAAIELASGGVRPAAPAPLPLALTLAGSLLCALALIQLTDSSRLATAGGLLFAAGSALALALARPWATVLLPWATGAAALLALIGAHRALRLLARRLLARFVRGAVLDTGIAVALVIWLLLLGGALLASGWLPGADAWQLSLPLRVGGALMALALLVPALSARLRGLARPAHALVALISGRRGATLLLGLFLTLWLGYVAWAIARLPYVGHADYADNAVVARNLAAGRGWVVDYVTQFYELNPGNGVTRPQETWPLLQPVWMAPFLALLGPSNWAAKIPNLIFTLILGLAVYSAGARLWDRRVGLVAAVLLLTSRWFFFLAIYTTTDLAFTVFAFGAVYLLYRSRSEASGEARDLRVGAPELKTQNSKLKILLGAALLTGLMMLQKPSGGLIAFGMGLWMLGVALWGGWQPGLGARAYAAGLLRRLAPVAAWSLVALLVLSPYLARNMATFGALFHSTESYDAWVLSYTDWEDIYKVYTPEQGLSETGGLPDRSWILRWGFDRALFKLETQVRAVRDYLAPPWRNLPLDLSDWIAGRDSRALLAGAGSWLGLLGLLGLARRRPKLFGLLLLAFGPYTLFLITYWHADEQRYFVVAMPWLALLAAAALWRIYDRAAAIGGGVWAPAALSLVAAALLAVTQPSWPAIADKVANEPAIHAADLDAYAWLRANARPDEVVMTRNPWQFNWAAERPALMVPNTASEDTFLKLARHYRARYLVRDTVQNPSPEAIGVINRLLARGELTLAYETPPYRSLNERGEPQQLQTRVYRFATEGTAEQQP
ncbi:MAG TPA: glycosyltransferase family 39 protein [Roseiflexaceae bacterium]|nr:glycosyltransferase family 39 protein [Roseiflexaceae bacterium]